VHVGLLKALNWDETSFILLPALVTVQEVAAMDSIECCELNVVVRDLHVE
jgi:hypothetical protein